MELFLQDLKLRRRPIFPKRKRGALDYVIEQNASGPARSDEGLAFLGLSFDQPARTDRACGL